MSDQKQNKPMVQATNNTSIVSKNSACTKGYFKDPFLQYFGRSKQRTALINRGYYIRHKAMKSALHKFLSINTDKYFQIVSLGAGYDTTYFRLKSQLPDTAKFLYIEVDFKAVINKKLRIIDQNPILQDLVGTLSKLRHPRLSIYTTEQYVACGLDISRISELDLALWALSDLDFKAPTLIISECVLSYIHPKKGDGIIEFLAKSFPNAAFLAYEQVFPGDDFGNIMFNHFQSMQSPLQSLTAYTTPEEQCTRYTSLGWSWCDITNMNDFATTIQGEEWRRVATLEVFDEPEEWHLKCGHYTLLCAHQGQVPSLLPSARKKKELISRPQVEWNLTEPNPYNKRCGHQTVMLEDKMVTVGGYGTDPESVNQRLTSLLLHDTGLSTTIQPSILPSRTCVYSTSTLLPSSDILVVGGRGNPLEVSPTCLKLRSSGEVEESAPLPVARWRHSASLLNGSGLLVFGGLEEGYQVSADCYLLDLESSTWNKVAPTSSQPCARYSHSSVSCRDSVILSGGLDSHHQPLSCVFQYRSSQWSRWEVNGPILPRYSHTSHIHQDKWLLLVGGVNNLDVREQPGIGVISLDTRQVQEYALPTPHPDRPFLCYKHSSVIVDDELRIVGGGGYCFSFGIHLNSSLAILPQLSSLMSSTT